MSALDTLPFMIRDFQTSRCFHIYHMRGGLKMKSHCIDRLAAGIALTMLLLVTSGKAQVTNVTATGAYPADVLAVQSAVDIGGTVLLHGNFNFGTASWVPGFQEGGGITISKPNVTLMGAYQARISGGGKLVQTPDGTSHLCVIHVNAPGVRVNNIESENSPDAGILIYVASPSPNGNRITIDRNRIGGARAAIFLGFTTCPVDINGNTVYTSSLEPAGYGYGIRVNYSGGPLFISRNDIVGIPSYSYLFGIDVESCTAPVRICGNTIKGCGYGIGTYNNGGPNKSGCVEMSNNFITAGPIAISNWYADMYSYMDACPVEIRNNTIHAMLDQPGSFLPDRHMGIWVFSWSPDALGGVTQTNPPMSIKGNDLDIRFPLGDLVHTSIGIWLGGGAVGINNATVDGNRISGKAMVGIQKNEYGKNNLFIRNDLSGLKTWRAQICVWARQTTVLENVLGFANVIPGYSTGVELASNKEFGAGPMPLPVDKCVLSLNDYRKTELPGWSASTSGCVHIFSYADKGGVGTEVKSNLINEVARFPAGTTAKKQVLLESSALVHDNYVFGLSPLVCADAKVAQNIAAIQPTPEESLTTHSPEEPTEAQVLIKKMFEDRTPAAAGMKVPTSPSQVQNGPLFSSSAALCDNYPNPFNPVTTIRYALPVEGDVSLVVFDLQGQKVAQLVEGRMSSGYHDVQFDGSSLASGVYFYRIQSGSFTQTKRFVLLR